MVLYSESMSKRKSQIKAESKKETQSEPEKPVIEYNNRTFQSYVRNNFADKIPHSVEAPDTRMKRFISRVDMTKGFE